MTYGNLYLIKIGESLVEIVGETLGCGTDSVDVHAVCAGTHNATQAACAEFEIFVERFDEVGLIFVVEHGLNGCAGFGVVAVREPLLGFLSHLFDEFLLSIHVSYDEECF